MAPPPVNGSNTATTVHGTQFPQNNPTQAKVMNITVTHSDHKNNPNVPPQVFSASTARDPKNGYTEEMRINGKPYYFKDDKKTMDLKIAYLLDKDNHKLQAKVSPLTTSVSGQGKSQSFVPYTPSLGQLSKGGNTVGTTKGKTAPQVITSPPKDNPKPTAEFKGMPYYGPLGLKPSNGQGVNIAANKIQNDIDHFKAKVPQFHFSRGYTPHHGPSMRPATIQPQDPKVAQHNPTLTNRRNGDVDMA